MPSHTVVGGGVNGLSVAWHLAERGADVLLLDKGRLGSGATGIAGGIVRNYYRSEAITALVRMSVEMFEEDPEGYGFHQVGYIAAVPQVQVADLIAIRQQHERAGYGSELVLGADNCAEYLRWRWSDWEAPVEALLHERRGGWADPMQTVRRLADHARAAGVEIREGVEVYDVEDGALRTSEGRLTCETLVLAPGPWIAQAWSMLGPDAEPLRMEYWKAQEGEFELKGSAPASGPESPVVHLDQSEPLQSDRDGRVLVPGAWGIYFRLGRSGGITGGGLPVMLPAPELDPYGPDNPEHAAEPDFEEFFVSGLATAMRRFRGRAADWRVTVAGGIVAHTRDNYPICDWALPGVYAIVDSGHGFKTLAVGRLAAADILDGGEPALEPFRLERFAQGKTHAASKGPYPWT